MENQYCGVEVLNLLKNCVKSGINLVFYGETASLKEECCDFFTAFVPEDEKVIWIKDTQEWHLNPKWIMLTGTRFKEAVYVTNCFNHTNESEIYNFVDAEVLLGSVSVNVGDKEKRVRYIERICFFDRRDTKFHPVVIVEDGKIINRILPDYILDKMTQNQIIDAFSFGGRIHGRKLAIG